MYIIMSSFADAGQCWFGADFFSVKHKHLSGCVIRFLCFTWAVFEHLNVNTYIYFHLLTHFPESVKLRIDLTREHIKLPSS